MVKEEIAQLPFVKKEIGIDLGVSHTIINNEGEKISNPKHLEKNLRTLKKRQRSLSKKQKGSKNREKARRIVARCHAKIKDKHLDFLHKTTSKIVNENQVIAVEDLTVKKMQKNKSLSRAISDCGFSIFLTLLEYKCKWYGREIKGTAGLAGF